MDFGICVASRPADLQDVVDAERLGFSHAWLADSQMIWSDNGWVVPEEERFVTKELIEVSCLVGTPDDLRTRVAELDDAGLDQIVILPPLAAKNDIAADVARELIGRTP